MKSDVAHIYLSTPEMTAHVTVIAADNDGYPEEHRFQIDGEGRVFLIDDRDRKRRMLVVEK